MEKSQAERFLSDYKRVLKQWAMTSIGIRADDALSLFQRLKHDLPKLAQIATDFPDLAYSVDMLSNALLRDYPDQAARTLRPDDMTFR